MRWCTLYLHGFETGLFGRRIYALFVVVLPWLFTEYILLLRRTSGGCVCSHRTHRRMNHADIAVEHLNDATEQLRAQMSYPTIPIDPRLRHRTRTKFPSSSFLHHHVLQGGKQPLLISHIILSNIAAFLVLLHICKYEWYCWKHRIIRQRRKHKRRQLLQQRPRRSCSGVSLKRYRGLLRGCRRRGRGIGGGGLLGRGGEDWLGKGWWGEFWRGDGFLASEFGTAIFCAAIALQGSGY